MSIVPSGFGTRTSVRPRLTVCTFSLGEKRIVKAEMPSTNRTATRTARSCRWLAMIVVSDVM